MAIANDLSIFMIAGRTIADGGTIYKDYIDIKQPFFFQIYSWIYQLFGMTEIAPRIADSIIQVLTALMIYKSASLVITNFYQRILPGLIYLTVYVTMGNGQTGYPESFLGLFLSFIVYILITGKTGIWQLVILGIISGFATGLKYTFGVGIVPAVIILIYLPKNKISSNLLNILIYLSTFFVALLLSHFLSFSYDFWDGYSDVLKWTVHYSRIQSFNAELIKSFLSKNAEYWGYHLSILISFSMVVAIYAGINKEINSYEKIIRISIILFIFLFISVVIEKKFSAYMFSRLLVPISFISSIGLFLLYNRIRTTFGKINKLYLVLIFLTVFIFSPAVKYSKSLIIGYTYFLDKDKYDQFYQIDDIGASRVTFIEMAKHINNTTPKNKRILIISNGANILSFMLYNYKQSAFAQSCFYLNEFGMQNYENMFAAELRDSDVLVINTEDGHPAISGNTESSLAMIEKNDKLNSILKQYFESESCFGYFIIYRRKM